MLGNCTFNCQKLHFAIAKNKLRQGEHENESQKNIKKTHGFDNVIANDGEPIVSTRNERLCPREQ